jgi:mRNA interferase MazF
MTKPNNGEVWLANLNPGRGTEPGKMRPVLIVQGQALLDAGHPSTLIVPLTTNLMNNAAPLRLRVPARERLDQDSDLLIDQLRAIDNRRLTGGPLARLSIAAMREVYRAIADVLEIPDEALNLALTFQSP